MGVRSLNFAFAGGYGVGFFSSLAPQDRRGKILQIREALLKDGLHNLRVEGLIVVR